MCVVISALNTPIFLDGSCKQALPLFIISKWVRETKVVRLRLPEGDDDGDDDDTVMARAETCNDCPDDWWGEADQQKPHYDSLLRSWHRM